MSLRIILRRKINKLPKVLLLCYNKAITKEKEEASMAVYKCSVCGYLFDEEKEGKKFETLTECPVCHQPVEKFQKVENKEQKRSGGKQEKTPNKESNKVNLAYPAEYARQDESCRYMKEIHEMAVSGHSIHAAMGTTKNVPSWDDILILGAQLNPMPLDENAKVTTTVVIGKHAKRPMILENPVYVSHMSFGALSREVKIALAKGAAQAKAAMCSGKAESYRKKGMHLIAIFLNMCQISMVIRMRTCERQMLLK